MIASKKPATTAKKTLDEALRYLYASLVYLEVPIVAIRFRFNHQNWEADTVEEAVALRAKLESSVRFPPDPHREMARLEKFWTPDKFKDVIDNIGALQHRLLIEVHKQPNISGDLLRQQLGLESEVALAGVISGLSKQLKKMQIEPRQVFLIKVDWKGKNKNRTFLLDDFFVGAGTEQNWPDAWELERILK